MCGKCWDRDRRWSEANLCDQWSNQGTNQGTTLFNKHHLPYHFIIILSSPWHRSFAAEVLKSWYSLRSLVCWCCWWTKFPCHLVWMVWIVDVGCCVELCKVVLGDVEKCLIAIRSLSMLINECLWMIYDLHVIPLRGGSIWRFGCWLDEVCWIESWDSSSFPGEFWVKTSNIAWFFCLAMEKPLVTEPLQIIRFVHPAPKWHSAKKINPASNFS